MVTAQQLKQASNLALQIAEANEALRETIEAAISLKLAGVDLSDDQTVVNRLQTQYAAQKTVLGSLVQQLP